MRGSTRIEYDKVECDKVEYDKVEYHDGEHERCGIRLVGSDRGVVACATGTMHTGTE